MLRLGLTITVIVYSLISNAQGLETACNEQSNNQPKCPSMSTGQPLNAFDARVKEGPKYGLNEREARDRLFNRIVEHAIATRDPSALDVIPLNSITADQQDKLANERINIQQLKRTETYQKLEDANMREAKAVEQAQSDILAAYKRGEPIDLVAMSTVTFKDEYGLNKVVMKPELFDYAQRMKRNPVQNPAESFAFAISLSERLSNAKISGNFYEAFRDDPVYSILIVNNRKPSDSEIMHAIASDRRMNEAEKIMLIKALPEMKTSNR